MIAYQIMQKYVEKPLKYAITSKIQFHTRMLSHVCHLKTDTYVIS